MARQLSRRQAIAGVVGAASIGTGASVAGADADPALDAVLDADRDAAYPRCVYKPTDDGGWDVALPVNVHARATGDRSALAAVEDAFTGLGNVRWTPVFPDSTAKAWDRREETLVGPDRSYRRPRLGDGWAHVLVWAIDDRRVAIHAHLDVLDLAASHFHRGDHYDDAARRVTKAMVEDGWRERSPYEIEYGVDDDRLERWGATGDAKVEW